MFLFEDLSCDLFLTKISAYTITNTFAVLNRLTCLAKSLIFPRFPTQQSGSRIGISCLSCTATKRFKIVVSLNRAHQQNLPFRTAFTICRQSRKHLPDTTDLKDARSILCTTARGNCFISSFNNIESK